MDPGFRRGSDIRDKTPRPPYRTDPGPRWVARFETWQPNRPIPRCPGESRDSSRMSSSPETVAQASTPSPSSPPGLTRGSRKPLPARGTPSWMAGSSPAMTKGDRGHIRIRKARSLSRMDPGLRRGSEIETRGPTVLSGMAPGARDNEIWGTATAFSPRCPGESRDPSRTPPPQRRPRRSLLSPLVTPGLDPGVQKTPPRPRNARLDGRVKPGHDDERSGPYPHLESEESIRDGPRLSPG